MLVSQATGSTKGSRKESSFFSGPATKRGGLKAGPLRKKLFLKLETTKLEGGGMYGFSGRATIFLRLP